MHASVQNAARGHGPGVLDPPVAQEDIAPREGQGTVQAAEPPPTGSRREDSPRCPCPRMARAARHNYPATLQPPSHREKGACGPIMIQIYATHRPYYGFYMHSGRPAICRRSVAPPGACECPRTYRIKLLGASHSW